MNTRITRLMSLVVMPLLISAFLSFSTAEQQDPWKKEQLLEPAELAETLNDPNRKNPVILSLGAGKIIPGSKAAGETGTKEGLETFRKALEEIPKDAGLVIYCGCCPFDICPNVPPAFQLLNAQNFTNHRLLNLRDNIKVDWIDKNYPVSRQ